MKSNSNFRMLILSFLLSLITLGCYDSSVSAGETVTFSPKLLGLYEGTAVYQGTGYRQNDVIQYYRFKSDSTFYWVELQLFQPFANTYKKPIDTSIKYFMYSDLKGNFKEWPDSIQFFNMNARDAKLSSDYYVDNWTPLRSYSYVIKSMFPVFTDTLLSSNIGGGGSNSDGEYSYRMIFRRIGDENTSIPMLYLGK
ncbi:MAG: hypothetical protein IPO40_22850 [Fibrobacteres bacterium]|nr:hypothetical protein [Fibrobacterota bacterium]